MTPEEAVAKIRQTVDEWDDQYVQDDAVGASINPFYLINDLREILAAVP